MRTLIALVPALAATLVLAGCLERFESITIEPTGAVAIRAEFRGSPDDFVRPADALPEAGSVWSVTQRDERTPDAKPRVVRTATLALAPGQPIPETYAQANDARADAGLRFPTTIRVVPMGAHTYYQFERTYLAREEARFAFGRNAILESDPVKRLKDRKPESFTDAERFLAVRSLIRVEADRQSQFVTAAASVLEQKSVWSPDIGLILRTAALSAGEQLATDSLAALLKKPANEARDAELAAELRAVGPQVQSVVNEMLLKLGVRPEEQAQFKSAYAAEQLRRQATEDLADERWEVRVRLPGTIAAHNAARVENGELVWEFPAAAFADRTQQLRAVSWLPTQPQP